MAVLAQFYFGVLAALAQLGVLAQFYFGGSTSLDPPHPPGRVCTPKYFFRFWRTPKICSQCKHNEIQRVGQQFWLTLG